MSPSETTFYNSTLNRYLDFDELVSELVKYIQEKPRADYRITVGTDSAADKEAQFVTAITILRAGNGGRYFWTRSEKIFCPSLRDRVYKETMRSIVFTQELRSRLKERIGEESFWDDKITIHLDVGKNGPTKDLIEAVVGMVRGYGFEPVIKPSSFGAFVVADRHT